MASRRMTEVNMGGVASELVRAAGERKVWFFSGEMGSGKTTLIKSICALLGVRDRVCSPTFTLINVYNRPSGEEVYHFDFYRLTTPSDVLEIGAHECFRSGTYCFVEWPKVAEFAAPKDCFRVAIVAPAQHERIIHYTSTKS